jgi:spore maturation protein CgeB
MSNHFKDLDSFGFRDGKNIVIYQDPIEDQIELMLQNKDRLKKIGMAGYDLVH